MLIDIDLRAYQAPAGQRILVVLGTPYQCSAGKIDWHPSCYKLETLLKPPLVWADAGPVMAAHWLRQMLVTDQADQANASIYAESVPGTDSWIVYPPTEEVHENEAVNNG